MPGRVWRFRTDGNSLTIRRVPARVVVVHDCPESRNEVTEALRRVGHDVLAFADPMLALSALEAADPVDVLVTRIGFPEGKPNGVALARMVRHKWPAVRVLFVARREFEDYTQSVGDYIYTPIKVPDVVDAVAQLLHRTAVGSPRC